MKRISISFYGELYLIILVVCEYLRKIYVCVKFCHRYKAKNICERKQRNQNTISAQENIIHKFENN